MLPVFPVHLASLPSTLCPLTHLSFRREQDEKEARSDGSDTGTEYPSFEALDLSAVSGNWRRTAF